MDNYQKSYFCRRVDQHVERELGAASAFTDGVCVTSPVDKEIIKRNRRAFYPWRLEFLDKANSLKDRIVLHSTDTPVKDLEAFCEEHFAAEELTYE